MVVVGLSRGWGLWWLGYVGFRWGTIVNIWVREEDGGGCLGVVAVEIGDGGG